ncbi:hypothetical protein Rhe02_33700 [Rhizocola hellebori]|uniref:LPXTG cell wall anchor domain-containing protein n=1 Tax=Rhizocola hellebori TaxID=1392758 RepID=A0A8J3Q8S6_9ACTN|nr:hypothetical protein [Rhizocola hellebori]GIH05303.1 hypothetical protein Rhe02_33700 [Rhizocola hellebori]
MSLLKRGLAAAACVATISTIPVPAAAAAKSPVVLAFAETLVPDDGAAARRFFTLRSAENFTFTQIKLTVDLTGLSGVATVTTSPSCTTAAATITCTWHEISGPYTALPWTFDVKAAPGAKIGDSGQIKATLESSDQPTITGNGKITIAEGVDLAAATFDSIGVQPGATFDLPLAVINAGKKAVNGVAVVVYKGFWLSGPAKYTNCLYDAGQVRACVFDNDLAVGARYGAALPMTLRTDSPAGEYASLEAIWLTTAELELLKAELGQEWFGSPGSGGGELDLIQTPTAMDDQVDTDPFNSWTGYTIEMLGDKVRDFAAIGGTGSGAVGDTITLDVGIKNVGNATHYVEGDPFEGRSQVTLTVPPGASLKSLPTNCQAVTEPGVPDANPKRLDASLYECLGPELIEAGKSYTFPISFVVNSVISSATGSLEETWLTDANPANNKAPIVLNAPGGGGGLPITGPKVTLIAVVGLLLLAAGLVIVVATRRRKSLPLSR